MKLNHLKGSGITSEYLCEITDELDKQSGLGRKPDEFSLYHYIIIDEFGLKNRELPIRVHGGTVGCINIDENNTITSIVIDTNYVVKTYSKEVNDVMEGFIGIQLEW